MLKTALFSIFLGLNSMVFSAYAATPDCEGGAYLNLQLFSSNASSSRTIAEQEMRAYCQHRPASIFNVFNQANR